MKIGKVSNAVLDRSVLKYIEKRGAGELLVYPAVGAGASVFKERTGNLMASSDCGIEPVYTAANNIYAAGGKPCAVQCVIAMPESCREIRLKEIMSRLSADCAALGLEISGGHTQVIPGTGKPVVSVTALGWRAAPTGFAKPGEDIVMTKCIGIGGIQYIIDSKRDEILKKYSAEVIERAYGARSELSVAPEALAALEIGVGAMHDMSCGGVYAALWDMAEASGVGLDIDFRAIAVRQEIIEICELFDINPYQLNSCGSLIMTSSDGEQIVGQLEERGIEACVIGRTTDGNDRVLRNLDEVRYIEKTSPDEIYRVV